eukprot:TRINITY_DN3031_c0_g1_i2.p1 TRINITY_DN3031_c0_g1~~TRINITY_DN3031_c0_g1_i2.p1  ORF type:complete len:130 (+),score=10.00 TRINITY_DN3031_c0_g1_i2:142-531(+)
MTSELNGLSFYCAETAYNSIRGCGKWGNSYFSFFRNCYFNGTQALVPQVEQLASCLSVNGTWVGECTDDNVKTWTSNMLSEIDAFTEKFAKVLPILISQCNAKIEAEFQHILSAFSSVADAISGFISCS